MLRAFVNRALSVVTDVYLNENSAAAGKEQKPRVTEVVSSRLSVVRKIGSCNR